LNKILKRCFRENLILKAIIRNFPGTLIPFTLLLYIDKIILKLTSTSNANPLFSSRTIPPMHLQPLLNNSLIAEDLLLNLEDLVGWEQVEAEAVVVVRDQVPFGGELPEREQRSRDARALQGQR
jgi:hypothetical protein